LRAFQSVRFKPEEFALWQICIRISVLGDLDTPLNFRRPWLNVPSIESNSKHFSDALIVLLGKS
jgi:hypothetical protein